MTTEFVRLETPRTVFSVWQEILEKRPEVVKQTVNLYTKGPHGQPKYNRMEVLPIERIKWSDDELAFYGNKPFVKSIGQAVEIRPADYDPTIDYSGSGRWFNEGDILELNPNRHRSFLFVDLESHPSKELLSLTINALKGWRTDWYLLDSGGSFHLIINKLVESKNLPKYFGQLIMDFSRQLSYPKAKLYGHVGNYLIKNSDNLNRLSKWSANILATFGHVDDPICEKLVFPIDLRYIAHVIESICNGNIDDGNLRVSSKYGSVPVLIAQQMNEKVLIYECQDDPFDRHQLILPGF